MKWRSTNWNSTGMDSFSWWKIGIPRNTCTSISVVRSAKMPSSLVKILNKNYSMSFLRTIDKSSFRSPGKMPRNRTPSVMISNTFSRRKIRSSTVKGCTTSIGRNSTNLHRVQTFIDHNWFPQLNASEPSLRLMKNKKNMKERFSSEQIKVNWSQWGETLR